MKDKISALMDGELDDKSTAEMIDSLGVTARRCTPGAPII